MPQQRFRYIYVKRTKWKRLATIRYFCNYGEKSESHSKGGGIISTYEEMMILLTFTLIVIQILQMMRK